MKKIMVKRGLMTLLSASALLLGGVVIDQSTQIVHAANRNWVEVTYTSHLRQGPGTNYGSARYLQPGERYNYYETRNNGGYTWYRLTPTDWVASAGAKAYQTDSPKGIPGVVNPPATSTQGTPAYGWLQTNQATAMRNGAGSNNAVLNTLPAHVAYHYYAKAEIDGVTWYRVTPNGWVMSPAVSVISDPVTTNQGTPAYGWLETNWATSMRNGTGLNNKQLNILPAHVAYNYYAKAEVAGIMWYRVTGTGWVAGFDIQDTTADNTPTSPVAEFGWLKTNHATVMRDGAGKYMHQLNTLPAAVSYNYYAKSQVNGTTWYRVTPNGWVSGADVSITGAPAKPQPIAKVLGVQFISQEAAGAPMGCEAASALQALHYKGHALNLNLSAFLKTMPIAANGNPYYGFGGTPYQVVSGVYQSIFPRAFTPWIAQFGNATDMTGQNVDRIIEQVQAGNPVVAWVTLNYQVPQWHTYDWGQGIDNAHVVTVDGYNNESLHIVDPENGTYWVNKQSFTNAYNYMKFAVSVH
jgi:uncharacterized protein YvpB